MALGQVWSRLGSVSTDFGALVAVTGPKFGRRTGEKPGPRMEISKFEILLHGSETGVGWLCGGFRAVWVSVSDRF